MAKAEIDWDQLEQLGAEGEVTIFGAFKKDDWPFNLQYPYWYIISDLAESEIASTYQQTALHVMNISMHSIYYPCLLILLCINSNIFIFSMHISIGYLYYVSLIVACYQYQITQEF